MKLLVCCHRKEAYLIPDKLFDAVKKADRQYDSGEDLDTAIALIAEIKEKYKKIDVGYLLTGDLN